MNVCRKNFRRGFSLIELIVVVGIILILVSILIPALGGARMSVQTADSKSQLASLSTACESYYQIFQAYPGPVSEKSIAANTGVISGNQNLLIGLGRKSADTDAKAGGTTTEIKGSSTPAFDVFVDTKGTQSPTDFSRNGTNGVPYPAYSFSTKDYHPTTKLNDLPVLVDRYKESMPLLYYRKYVGRTDMTAGGTSAAYEQNANKVFYGSEATPVTSGIGSSFAQEAITDAKFKTMLGNKMDSTNYMPKGGYVLVSAGADHLYGTSDDIIVAGGN